MSRRSPYEIRLTPEECCELGRRANSYSKQHWVVMRAKMILLAAGGLGNDVIAAKLGTRREVVSRWRKRFFYQRLAGIDGTPGKERAGERASPSAKGQGFGRTASILVSST